jgi:YD repeat-containing protein
MNWNGFLGLTSVSSGNGASQSFGYDAYARPTTTNSADGAQTTYTYSTSPAMSTASINSRWSKTYYDGVGRPVKVESGDAGGVKSTVLTEYEPCACSPMGKMKRVSLPYAPGGTVYWTVYTYDGLGRTLSVAQPNGSGTTTYLYVGNTVKVTSPSGKWKQYEMDAIGRMTLVTEPRPGGGTYTTSYGYNMMGKLVSVSMPRDGVTQTRTFTYDTTTQSRLLSATNPENGTVSYTYNADGTTATKTDAKGIKTEFAYDAYKRVLQMRKLTQVSSVWTEDRCQRTDYFYDEGGGTNNGRLTRVKWNWMLNASNVEVPCSVAGGFTESYSYNAAGRILSKNLTLTRTSNGNTGSASLVANWTYNNEGQVTSVTYPQRFEGNFQSRREVTHGYDAMARLNSVQTKLGTENQQNPAWQSVISNVQFNAFGAVTSLNHLGVTESRTYNVLGQMTRMTKGSLIDVEYRFSATANDGKILSQKNWLSGEDVTYQYL